MSATRPYALVLYGATGFTGGLCARYLARKLPAGTPWALAGRNRAKLEQVAAGLPGDNPPELIEAAEVIREYDPYPKPLCFHTLKIDEGVDTKSVAMMNAKTASTTQVSKEMMIRKRNLLKLI